MKSKFALLILLLSLSLNIAFIAVWAARTIPANKPSSRCSSCVSDTTCGVWCPLHKSLGATDEQWRTLEPLQQEFQRTASAQQDSIDALRGQLMDLMSDSVADRAAIQSILNEMTAVQNRVQNNVVNHLLAEKHILTRDQQAKLFEMMRCNRGCANRGLMRGQPSAGHGHKNCGSVNTNK